VAAFEALCELPSAEQLDQLLDLGAEDPALADEVAELLGLADTDDAVLPGVNIVEAIATHLAAETDAEALAPPLAHQRVGPFQLEEQLGVGGSGAVYRALHEDGTEVAVKFLHPAGLEDRRAVSRFRREFRAAARLKHPHCVRVLAEGTANGQRYFSMEYLRGGHLGDLVGASLEVLLPLLIQVADALGYIHGQRIVHRDLKPFNVLLTDTRPAQAKIADFGIALDERLVRLTQTQGVVGTLDYLSPEQVAGEAVDARSDLYALGCMIWRLLTGRPAFDGPVLLRGVARVGAAPRSVRALQPEVPGALDHLLQRLMAPERAGRPPSALSVAHELMRIFTEVCADAPPARLSEQPHRGVAYHPGVAGRVAELAAARSHLEAAAAGRAAAPLALLVRATAGVGKTTFVAHLLAHAEADAQVRFQAPAQVPPRDALEHVAG